MTERVLQSAGFLSRLRGRRAAPRGAYDPSFFLRRTAAVVGMALVFVALGALSGTYVGFDFMQAILDVPGGLVWMATQFVPSLTSLQKLDTILPALGSTILASIASSCTAAVLAYICAVLGSRSVGVGGPFPLIVRAVASLFRNIPVNSLCLNENSKMNAQATTGMLRNSDAMARTTRGNGPPTPTARDPSTAQIYARTAAVQLEATEARIVEPKAGRMASSF